MRGYSERAGVRSVFGIWLFYVGVLVFTLTSAVSFVNTTVGERLEAAESIDGSLVALALLGLSLIEHSGSLEVVHAVARRSFGYAVV